jgi:DNA-binding LacI/PurR family transcriptional regulator
VDGAILLAGPDFGPHLVKALRAEPCFGERPIVSLQKPLSEPGCSAVLTDDWRGAYATMTHLLELGHRAVAHFVGEPLGGYLVEQRLAAYRQACHDFGADPQGVLHLVEWDLGLRWQSGPMAEALLAWLRHHPEVTAVLAITDEGAVAIWEVLAAAGYRIPEQLSLVGFGDLDPVPGGALGQENQLTTVQLPLTEVGCEAARLLIGQVTGEIVGDRQVTLPTSLVVRRSTGSPPRR